MVKSRRFITLVTASVLAVALVMAGCHGNRPDGVYTDTTGHLSLEFRGGKAYLNMGGMADPDGTPYDVNGDKITNHYPPDSMITQFSVFTINSDGTLQGAMGILKKK